VFDIEFNGTTHTVDPDSLVAEEWRQVALELGAFAMRTGIEPDVEVKAAAVALLVLRRLPSYSDLPFVAVVAADEVEAAPSPFDGLPLEQQIRLLAGMSV